MSESPVLIVGPNPAWQRVAKASSIRLGEVVRLRRQADCPAGKGFNCAQAIFHLGGRPILVGGCGPDATAWESACRDDGVETASFPLDGSIRQALTLVDGTTGICTELVEEGPPASHGADRLLEVLLAQRLPNAAAMVVCGSFPAGLSTESVLNPWRLHPVPLIIDSVPVASEFELPENAPRVVIKLNVGEWQVLLGPNGPDALLREAQARWPGIEAIATLGREGCLARTREGRPLRREPPPFPFEQKTFPIGAGDAFCAGLAKIVALGGTLEQGLDEGLALARASCLHPLPARFYAADLQRMREGTLESARLP